ncbi:hypothetical protein BCR37DRAFT_383432 [Protomyces lactucae-debilis]|uniref:Uncharacterized protein n=1 Tax=Protomyces lactucae-debilis TaxID=2754530 RepID=A0A1Y2EXL3_PROLT|nr:uncharacterized protein BCR37DRAFT_383432 [Protomyces lactucae-debilis]ORY76351.1 hypothetical protein BCR37DRAFT_383432 [Protomyces lactucae-debilis]
MGMVECVAEVIVLASIGSGSLFVDSCFALLWAPQEKPFQLVNDRLELPNVAVTPCDRAALRIDHNLVSFHQVPCMCRDVVPCGVAQWRSRPESHCES